MVLAGRGENNMLLKAIEKISDIPKIYQGTPIGLLLEYHSLGREYDKYTQAQLLIGMCMDSRKHLRIPDNFAFIIRSGGANLKYATFKASYAIGVGGAQAIALIGHNDCGMSNLESRREIFIQGMIERAGWTREHAIEHFNTNKDIFEIGNEIQFLLQESRRLRDLYPKLPVAPMLYNIHSNQLFLIVDDQI